MAKYEVRLYYKGRADWDTEFFDATSHTGARNEAAKIAKQHHADHHCVGQPTPQDEYKHSGPLSKTKISALGTNPKEQVAAVETMFGINSKKKKE
jgi:hypothetical protein